MNVGILTYHFVSNFGANLQTLSTFMYLKNHHNPIIIDWIPSDLEEYYNTHVQDSQNSAFQAFQEQYYTSKTIKCRTSEDIANAIKTHNIEHVIIGSDAVLTFIPFWQRFSLTRRGIRYYNPLMDSKFPNPFWGDFNSFLEKEITISLMSASAQNTNYHLVLSPFIKKQIATALEKFSYISVRDIWTQNMIKCFTKGSINPSITPDPVFAFNQNVGELHSKQYILEKFSLPEKYVLFSTTQKCFTDQWIKELEHLFINQGIKLIGLPIANATNQSKCIEHLSPSISPDDWYDLIKYASGYIGELMHPILVSLHNSTPLYAIDTYGFVKFGTFDFKSSKTYQILKSFNLIDNWYSIKTNTMVPSPHDVFIRIMHFDKQKCSQIAKDKLGEYNQMMENILINYK